MNHKAVRDYLTNEGIAFLDVELPDGKVAVFRVEDFGNFFMLDYKLELKYVEPDCGKAYVYCKHEDIPKSAVDEFVKMVKGFHATVRLPCRLNELKPTTGGTTNCFGLSASVFAPDGCLAVTDGELLSRDTGRQ